MSLENFFENSFVHTTSTTIQYTTRNPNIFNQIYTKFGILYTISGIWNTQN